jgi:hypothetical protein
MTAKTCEEEKGKLGTSCREPGDHDIWILMRRGTRGSEASNTKTIGQRLRGRVSSSIYVNYYHFPAIRDTANFRIGHAAGA